MRLTIRAKPGSKKAGVLKLSEREYEIAVVERPEKGKANSAVRRALAEYLNIAPSRVSLVMGESSRTKVFEILS